MSEITYDDKVDLQVATNIANINKVTASDMNEIKNVVNGNAEEVGDITSLTTTDKTSVVNAVNELNAPEKWVSVGATAPTDGTRVWFEYSRNILPENLYMATRTLNGITYTNNGDGTISFSGTATANTSIQLIPDSKMSFKAGQPYYLYSSVPYNSTTFNLSIALTENGATRYLLANGTYTPTYNSTQARLSLYIPSGTTINATNVKLMLIEGNTAPSEYEPYVEGGIYIDGEEWYNSSFAIKTKLYPSVTTSSSGYYNLNIKCNEVAIIGFTHDPVASATRLQLYSNEQGWWFIRCSVGEVYAEKTITNLKIYYI